MKYLEVQAGDVVVTQFDVYQHWSIVSERRCSLGKNMLISATKRTGTVQEEPWDDVTQGKRTYITVIDTEKSIPQILSDAHSQIGTWKYSLTDRNCEHFAKWATGLKMSSTQVVAGTTGAVLGAGLVGLCSENPKFTTFLCGALALGGLAILASKANEKK